MTNLTDPRLANRLPAPIRSALEKTGLPWGVEIGGSHFKIRLNGHLVGVIGKGRQTENSGHCLSNVVAQIRRAAKTSR